jgi:hypothetical protein
MRGSAVITLMGIGCNNSNVAIDLLIFTFYSDQLVIDVETGIVNK